MLLVLCEFLPLHNRDAKMTSNTTAIRDNVISVTRWCDVTEMT
jgi:hypothetical protein